MDNQKNLRVLQQYYAAVVKSMPRGGGLMLQYMESVVAQPVVDEVAVDSYTLLRVIQILQDAGFSDAYLNGRRRIGIKYGTVPLELEVWVDTERYAVSACRIGLYLRGLRKAGKLIQDPDHLCGQWAWNRISRTIDIEVPLDVTKVIWGVDDK